MPHPIGSSVLVYFLEAPAAGHRYACRRRDWPLHVTLVPWFTANESQLTQHLIKTLATCRPFRSRIGRAIQFNPDTRVSLIETPTGFTSLHNLLVSSLVEMAGSIQDDRFLGEAYRPHVTHPNEAFPLAVGTELYVDAVYVVRLLPNNICEVINRMPLGGINEAAA
jgi:hypothetical protein